MDALTLHQEAAAKPGIGARARKESASLNSFQAAGPLNQPIADEVLTPRELKKIERYALLMIRNIQISTFSCKLFVCGK